MGTKMKIVEILILLMVVVMISMMISMMILAFQSKFQTDANRTARNNAESSELTPVVERPMTEIDAIGQQITGVKGVYEIDAIVTAYCACEKCCGRWADGYTASGHFILKGDKFVATTNTYPFGTMVYIEGYSAGFVPVLDRGGSKFTDNHFDVYFDSHQDALNWGRKDMKVKISR